MVRNGIAAVAARITHWVLAAGTFGIVLGAAAQSMDDITLTLDSTTALPGDTVEVTVSMAVDGDAPSAMIVFLAYDPVALTPNENEYELILESFEPREPILDDDGNVIAMRRAVRPAERLVEAGFGFDSEGHPEQGVFGVVVFNQGSATIGSGALFTVAFTVSEDLADGTMTDVIGLTEDNAVGVPNGSGGVAAAATSASRPDGTPLTYSFENGVVMVGCEPPAAPTNVTATQNRSDGVLVRWSGVETPGAEYRVYRNAVNNEATAVPLGANWQTETTFLDITAEVPIVVAPEGCNMPEQVTEVSYFYWVRARTPEGCAGLLSANSATGFRAQAEATAAAAGMLLLPDSAAMLLIYAGMLAMLLWRRRATGNSNHGSNLCHNRRLID